MDPELKSLLTDIQDRLLALEIKITVSQPEENVPGDDNLDLGPTAGATVVQPDPDLVGDPAEVVDTCASHRLTNDILKNFDRVKDCLAKVTLPSNLKVQDSTAGIKQDGKAALRIISKSARFAETSLKQLSVISARQQEDKTVVVSDEELAALFTLSAAQIRFLQSEFASLVVRNTFDEETSRLFKSFENHASAFNSSSIQNLRIAADLAVARERASKSFARGRGFPRHRNFRQHGRGRGYNLAYDWSTQRRLPERTTDDSV